MKKKEEIFDLDFEHAHELWFSLKRNGWNNCDLRAASQGDFLGKVLKHMKENYVNLNKEPDVPHGEQIIHNNSGGLWEFNPGEVFFCNKSKYQSLDYLSGFNANLLDFLLKYRHLIPEEWKKYDMIFFPGTVYTSRNDFEQLRYLSWGTKWATKQEPEWWDGAMVINDIVENDKKLVFAMKFVTS